MNIILFLITISHDLSKYLVLFFFLISPYLLILYNFSPGFFVFLCLVVSTLKLLLIVSLRSFVARGPPIASRKPKLGIRKIQPSFSSIIENYSMCLWNTIQNTMTCCNRIENINLTAKNCYFLLELKQFWETSGWKIKWSVVAHISFNLDKIKYYLNEH